MTKKKTVKSELEKYKPKDDCHGLLSFDAVDFEAFGMFKIWLFFELDNTTHTTTLRAVISTKEHAEATKKTLASEIAWRNKKYKTNYNLHIEENYANHPFGAEMYTPQQLKYYYVRGRVIDGD